MQSPPETCEVNARGLDETAFSSCKTAAVLSAAPAMATDELSEAHERERQQYRQEIDSLTKAVDSVRSGSLAKLKDERERVQRLAPYSPSPSLSTRDSASAGPHTSPGPRSWHQP